MYVPFAATAGADAVITQNSAVMQQLTMLAKGQLLYRAFNSNTVSALF